MKTVIDDGQIDRVVYSYMSIRLFSYLLFLIVNGFQSCIEFKKLKKSSNNTKIKTSSSTVSTRFYIYISISLFCLFRVISTSLFYDRPTEYKIGTLTFLFFSLGTMSIFICWIFILQFWLIIMYSFFVTEEIGFNRIKPINITTIIFLSVIIIWIVVISSLGIILKDSLSIISMAQAYGFVTLLLIYSIIVIVFGSILLKSLKNHKKNISTSTIVDGKSNDQNNNHSVLFNQMIYKTKVLLITVIILFLTTFTQEVVFEFGAPIITTNNILSNFLVFIIDTTQMILVMFILSDGNFKNYFLFKKVKLTTSDSSSSKSSLSNNNNNNNNNSSITMDKLSKTLKTTSISISISNQNLFQSQNSQLSLEFSGNNSNIV